MNCDALVEEIGKTENLQELARQQANLDGVLYAAVTALSVRTPPLFLYRGDKDTKKALEAIKKYNTLARLEEAVQAKTEVQSQRGELYRWSLTHGDRLHDIVRNRDTLSKTLDAGVATFAAKWQAAAPAYPVAGGDPKQRRAAATPFCYQCKETGHVRWNCPKASTVGGAGARTAWPTTQKQPEQRGSTKRMADHFRSVVQTYRVGGTKATATQHQIDELKKLVEKVDLLVDLTPPAPEQVRLLHTQKEKTPPTSWTSHIVWTARNPHVTASTAPWVEHLAGLSHAIRFASKIVALHDDGVNPLLYVKIDTAHSGAPVLVDVSPEKRPVIMHDESYCFADTTTLPAADPSEKRWFKIVKRSHVGPTTFNFPINEELGVTVTFNHAHHQQVRDLLAGAKIYTALFPTYGKVRLLKTDMSAARKALEEGVRTLKIRDLRLGWWDEVTFQRTEIKYAPDTEALPEDTVAYCVEKWGKEVLGENLASNGHHILAVKVAQVPIFPGHFTFLVRQKDVQPKISYVILNHIKIAVMPLRVAQQLVQNGYSLGQQRNVTAAPLATAPPEGEQPRPLPAGGEGEVSPRVEITLDDDEGEEAAVGAGTGVTDPQSTSAVGGGGEHSS